MKVNIKVGLSCALGSFSAGEVVELADDIAGDLIKHGHAELVEETRNTTTQPVTRKATKWQKQDPVSDGHS
jgi:hypothetical protein